MKLTRRLATIVLCSSFGCGGSSGVIRPIQGSDWRTVCSPTEFCVDVPADPKWESPASDSQLGTVKSEAANIIMSEFGLVLGAGCTRGSPKPGVTNFKLEPGSLAPVGDQVVRRSDVNVAGREGTEYELHTEHRIILARRVRFDDLWYCQLLASYQRDRADVGRPAAMRFLDSFRLRQ